MKHLLTPTRNCCSDLCTLHGQCNGTLVLFHQGVRMANPSLLEHGPMENIVSAGFTRGML